MTDAEAAASIVSDRIARDRRLSYEDLVTACDEVANEDVVLATGTAVVLGTSTFWDDRPGGPVRRLIDVWIPKGVVSRSIAQDDFIKAPDGSFVGE